MYYISEALSWSKLNYSEIEKIAYAVLISTRKLKHYFQDHEIIVPMSQLLAEIPKNKKVSGRLGKWAAEISQFDISYVPRTAIKSQALADFMADWTPSDKRNDVQPTQVWISYTDGAWGQHGAAAAAILMSLAGVKMKYAVRLEFKATNNIAEYQGLILALNKAKAHGAKVLEIRTDSQIIVVQVEKECMAREPELVKYLSVVRALERRFQGFMVKYVPRAENKEADELAKAAATNSHIPLEVFYHVVKKPATDMLKMAFNSVMLVQNEDWRQVIIDTIHNSSSPKSEAEEHRMSARARNYTIIDNKLYKKGVVQPMLKCITQEEGIELLQEIHAGICGSHIGPRALSAKAIRQGFYWPTILQDAIAPVTACAACQYHAKAIH